MKNSETTIEESYQKHIDNESTNWLDQGLPLEYTDPQSIDAWRHNRMRKRILPLIKLFPNSKWITLGDGNFGTDAYYLQQKGLDVVSSSISDETISVAHKQGYIKKYSKINAEQIAEEDNSFDFVYCKEAYHHFPRPQIALYEMLRIARQGVVLIEPQDCNMRPLDCVRRWMKSLLRKGASSDFEEVGNYIYRINISELSKVMTALNHRYIAYKKLNDYYSASAATKSIREFNSGRLVTLFGIGIQNVLCKLRLMDYGLAVVVLFKNNVSHEILTSLRKGGFRIKKLPINPYLQD